MLHMLLCVHIASYPDPTIKLSGLSEDKMYYVDVLDRNIAGDVLMNYGLPVKHEHGDYKARLKITSERGLNNLSQITYIF